MLIKISNFSKFIEYITDSVRPVQLKSRHLVGIISKVFKKFHFNTLFLPLLLPFVIIYHSLSVDRFILIQNFIYGEKIDSLGLNWLCDLYDPWP